MIKNRLVNRIISSAIAGIMVLTAFAGNMSADVGQPVLTIPTLNQVQCAAYCVYDKTADEIILSYNPHDTVYPASMTKIMTAQLGMDYLDPDDYLTVSQNAIDNVTYDSTLMGICVGEEVQISELYYGMMLPSGNDAANVVAEGTITALINNYPADGDEVGPDGVNASYFEEQLGLTSDEILSNYKLTAFGLLMNLRAERLGCTGTHFVNPNGLHDDNHYTTASDMTLIMAGACTNPDFNTVISSPTHIFQGTNIHVEDGWSIVKNTNNLLNDPWLAATTPEGADTHLTAFIGGKTGTTSMAGTGMTVYTVNENGHELFISVCGIPGDLYAYQTRYVASVVAYGNLTCWENDPTSVIPGTTGDYRRFNSTDAELPQFDPLIIPGDMLEDFDPDAIIEELEAEETEPEEIIEDEEHDRPTPTPEIIYREPKDPPAIRFIKDNLVICSIVAVLVLLIVLCVLILIIRLVINPKNKRKKNKMRAYTGTFEDIKDN